MNNYGTAKLNRGIVWPSTFKQRGKTDHIAADKTNEKSNSLHEIKFFSIYFLSGCFYNNLSDYFVTWIINELN